MNKRMRFSILHYGIYMLLFYLIYILQSTPGFLEFWGYKPLLLAPCVVSVAMMEQEYIGGLFGALAGALCDIGANTYFGFNALMLLICGVAVGLLCEYLTQRNVRNCVLFTGATIGLVMVVNYFFQLGIYHYENASFYLLKKLAGVGLLTLVLTPLFFLLFSRLHSFFEARKQL